MVKDPQGLIDQINAGGKKFALTLGSGPTREIPGNITVDLAEHENVDISGDVFDVLNLIKNSSISSIYASHFFEHIDDIESLLKEVSRISAHDAEITIIVPHFSNAFFYSDVTHKRFFGLYSFCYFADCAVKFFRRVPSYSKVPGLVQTSVRLNFKSYRPFYVRHAIRRLFGVIVNSSLYTLEFYEENLSSIISCYEVEYNIRVEKS
jgi:ubiquinone/menaquinone biosynthesis C-methylase UbiE